MELPLILSVSIAICLLSTTEASTIKFEAYPTVLIANLTDAASIRCDVVNTQVSSTRSSSTSTDVRHISSIFITRGDGDDVASVTPFDAPQALTDTDNLEVKGAISGSQSGQGFIQLSWKDASRIQLGDYQCSVTAVDQKSHTVLLTSNLEMTSVAPSIMDVIGHVRTLESKVVSQETLLLSQASLIQDQKMKLERQASQLNITVSDILKLQTCTSARIAFTAYSDASRLGGTANVPIIFDKTFVNEGGDYNTATGVFKCSVSGVYFFYAHFLPVNGQDMVIKINRNGQRITTTFDRPDGNDYSSASIGATLHLVKGDNITLLNERTNLVISESHHYTSFSGHLIISDAC